MIQLKVPTHEKGFPLWWKDAISHQDHRVESLSLALFVCRGCCLETGPQGELPRWLSLMSSLFSEEAVRERMAHMLTDAVTQMTSDVLMRCGSHSKSEEFT